MLSDVLLSTQYRFLSRIKLRLYIHSDNEISEICNGEIYSQVSLAGRKNW